MSDNKHENGEVANPARTQIDGDDPLSQGQPTEDDEQQKQHHDPHDQPWEQVAEEVKEAVKKADGPLD